MSAIAEATTVAPDDRLAKRNAWVLAVAQALAGGNNSVVAATAGITGSMLAPDKGLATLPVSMMVLGIWFGTLPLGFLAKRYGRRFSLQTGSAFGVLGGLISCLAVLQGSFAIFLLGTFCCGIYTAAHNAYRFAATDAASDGFKPKAISFVLAGGVVAAIIGPSVVIATKDLWQPYLFAATFVVQAGLAAMAGLVLTRFKAAPIPVQERRDSGRPLLEIVRNRKFVVAVICGVASYALMNLSMTSAPLAMVDCGLSITDAALGIQWHVLGMFAPSFITGHLIVRYGVGRIMALGLVLILASAMIGMAGITVAHFWISLAVLGVGWNFTMQEIAAAIREGAQAYLNRQYTTIGIVGVVIFVIAWLLLGGWSAIGFADRRGAVGRCRLHRHERLGARQRAHRAGRDQVAGRRPRHRLQGGRHHRHARGRPRAARRRRSTSAHPDRLAGLRPTSRTVIDALVALGFGASLISIFARLGGGIFTKGADVGGDMVGKVEAGIPEDDPRNPATIADNVGDNVGDCAGMAADLFETYAVTVVATMVLAAIFFAGSRSSPA
jgi:MFS family permease